MSDYNYAIEAIKVNKIYKKSKIITNALIDFNINIPKGSIYGLLGPNGAGKSTFINILGGLVKKNSGSIKICGINIDKHAKQSRKKIGIVPQELNIDPFFTPIELLELQSGLYGVPKKKRKSEEILANLELLDQRNAYARTLSGGMRRRLLVAKALVHNPEIIILDEPTAGVDIEIRHSMWEFLSDLNNTGTTIILTTHYLEEAESLCRNIAIIDGGELVENTSMRDLLKRSNREIFVLDTETPMKYYPEGMSNVTAKDESTLEVEILKGGNLSEVIMALSKQGFTITSMRNKSNRLEQLFIDLVNDGHKNTGDSRE